MSRVIEFQGKTIADGKWISGNLYIENNLLNHPEYQYANYVYIEKQLDSNSTIRYLVIPNTVGQFTNVIGSDGKKIYDHDIVSNGKHQGEVYWNYGYNGWMVSVMNDSFSFYDTKLDNTYKVVNHKYDTLIHSNYMKVKEKSFYDCMDD